MNGIRHMLVVGIPVLLYTAVRCMQMLNRCSWQPELPALRQPFWRTDAMRLTGILVVSVFCFAIGFVISQIWLLPYFGVVDMSDTFYRPSASAGRYEQIFHGWLLATGVRNSPLPMVGIRGVSLIAGLFGFTYLLYVSFAAFRKEELSARNLLISMLAASFLSTTLIFVFESTERIFEQYYVFVCLWGIPVLALQLENVKARDTAVAKRLLALAACLCFMFQGAYTTLYVRADKDSMDSWECLYFDRFTAMDEVRDSVAFMQESGYTHAMTDYWYSNVMMEMTDGELTVAPMLVNYQQNPSIRLQPWGTSRSAFLQENLPSKILVFFERERAEEFEQHYPHAPLMHEGWILNAYELDKTELVSNLP